ncbi:Putative uncharacterized protein [Taphrina deformans PYCC 5710]|uniref:Uncharacterized protein n=1 Tax=Taphrina deformans (strain PYCC 5710 / ATCC 11124 / CBS 356.35 / IMI 108563 / JCM 9778 / NBRC 8474) TaxID=1097556 RepID=R4XBB6_TAPDE|nr:Putative uncharacterized protein [Taphrina deformans PYCC 5710]|eukprot:CCG83139.1 Putative uncharacterized protein [Taphrina deformans PYCC 5710]
MYKGKSSRPSFTARYIVPYRRYLLAAVVVLLLYHTLGSSHTTSSNLHESPAEAPLATTTVLPLVSHDLEEKVSTEKSAAEVVPAGEVVPGLLRGSTPQSKSTRPGALRFAIATFTTQERTYTHLVLKNKLHYAQRHNYDFILDTEVSKETRDRNICYHKLVMFDRLINSNQYDWIWWIDFDTLITNTTISLESIVEETLADVARPEEVDFILNHDCNQLNAGSMFVRSRPSTAQFLTDVNTYGYEHPDISEQDAVRDVIKSKDAVQPLLSRKSENQQAPTDAEQAGAHAIKPVVIVPQWKINAFPEEIKCYDSDHRPWEHGMFLAHFAGAWAYIKDEDPYGQLMRKYGASVIW